MVFVEIICVLEGSVILACGSKVSIYKSVQTHSSTPKKKEAQVYIATANRNKMPSAAQAPTSQSVTNIFQPLHVTVSTSGSTHKFIRII